MMIKLPFSGLFKGKSDKTDAPKSASNAKTEAATVTDVPIENLLNALDRTAQALTRFDLSEVSIDANVKTLNEMKIELSGLREARAIPALSSALGEMFEKSLLKAFLYGDAQQIEEVKSIIFKAIHALTQVSSLKEQQIATLDLNASAINGEIWETNRQIADREKERQQKWDALEVKDVFNIPKPIQMITTQIQELENRNSTAQTELDKISAERRNIEGDALGISFMETQKRISAFFDTLPSTADYVKAAQKIEEIKIQNEAKMANDAKMMAEAVTGADEALASFVSEMKKRTETQAEPAQTAEASETQGDAQMRAQPYSN